jgi:hypothetical protein
MTNHKITDHQAKREVSIASRMLEAWENQILVDRPLALPHQRKAALNLLYTHVFSSSLSRWDEFVELVASSKLIAQKFAEKPDKQNKLLNWAIKPENCLTILEGIYSNADQLCALDKAEVDGSATAKENNYEGSHE